MEKLRRVCAISLCVCMLCGVVATACAISEIYVCDCGGAVTAGTPQRGELLRRYTKYEDGYRGMAHYLHFVYEYTRVDHCSRGHNI